MKTKLVLSALAVCLGTASSAATITFDGLNHGDLIANGAFDFGGITGTIVTDSNDTAGPDIAQIFDTTETGTADPDLENPTETGTGAAYTGGNVMIISETGDAADPNDEGQGGSITLIFDQLVNFTGITLIDAEVARRYTNEIDVLIDGGVTVLDDIITGDNEFLDFTGFSYQTQSITVALTGSGAFDNLQLAPVPVPASAALLLGGLGGLALMRRRKAAKRA